MNDEHSGTIQIPPTGMLVVEGGEVILLDDDGRQIFPSREADE